MHLHSYDVIASCLAMTDMWSAAPHCEARSNLTLKTLAPHQHIIKRYRLTTIILHPYSLYF